MGQVTLNVMATVVVVVAFNLDVVVDVVADVAVARK
jgi:hypothetical protein